MASKVRVRITFRDQFRSWSVPGREMDATKFSVEDVTTAVAAAEEYLQRLTGLRVTIATEVE